MGNYASSLLAEVLTILSGKVLGSAASQHDITQYLIISYVFHMFNNYQKFYSTWQKGPMIASYICVRLTHRWTQLIHYPLPSLPVYQARFVSRLVYN